MYKNTKIIAIIPARKGSKGIPGKNIKKLNGIPLIGYTLQQATTSSLIDKIIVSTDSEEICKISEQYGVDVKTLRPEELATDTAILYDVVKYELINNKADELGFSVMILLQPTSPLRESIMIDEALKKFINEDQSSAVSISPVKDHPLFMRTIGADGELNRIFQSNSTVRRQDLPDFYIVNGMIYINWVIDILSGYVSFNDNKSPILISRKYSLDLDTNEDWLEAEKALMNEPYK